MVNDWLETTLGEVILTNHQSYSKNDNWSFINYLDTGNITENNISDVQYLEVGIDKIPSRAKRKVDSGDIIYSTVRPNQKHFGVIRNPLDNMLVSTGFTTIRCKSAEADTNFIYWFLVQPQIIEHLQSIGEQSASAYPSIKPSDIESLDIQLPPIEEQKAIANILGSLDDKIELNRQMNETLEAMAQALFKSWFVDFDPVLDNALAAGKPIPDEFSERAEQRKGIEKKDNVDIQDLFPDEFEFTEEMGWIPKGWEVTSLGKHIKFQTGPAFKSAEFAETGVKLARGDNVKEGRFQWGNKTRYWSYVDESLEKYLLKSGDVLIGMDGSKVGKNRTRVTESDLPCLLVQRVAKLSKKNTICSNFIFLVINSQRFRDYVDVIKTGSAIPHISGGQIKDLKIILPKNNDNPIFAKFEEFASAFINRIDSNVYDSKTLAKLRDTLLPKLMSGELRIPEAAALVDEAI